MIKIGNRVGLQLWASVPGASAAAESVKMVNRGSLSQKTNTCILFGSGNKVVVYGYSIGFGRCDHSLTADAIKASDPKLIVEWNNDGY